MLTRSIYLDESGCLGWSLDKPYGKGGSSRFLVLAAVSIPAGEDKHVERIIRSLYRTRERAHSKELKSTDLNDGNRRRVAKDIQTLAGKRTGISFHAVVAEKCNVNLALSQKSEALYNHMAEQMLGAEMAECARIDFYPDARTVKPKDKHALHNYLETRLAIAGSSPLITTTPSESGAFFQIQCADILASIVWAKYEYGSPVFDEYLANAVKVTKLF